MNKNKNETLLIIKPVYQRYVSIDENIHETLSLHALSLYMALRYNADFRKDESEIIRSAEQLYTKAKISRPQYYRCMNELENHGLVLRDPDNKLGEKCAIHVARELGFFKNNVQEEDRGVSHRDRGVSHRDTYHYSSSRNNINIITNSESCDSSVAAKKVNKKNDQELLWEMIAVYRETFPDNPQPHQKLISTSLKKTLQTLIKRWPEADPQGNALTIAAFRRYLTLLRENAPNFSLNAYVTSDGNKKKNNMETFCRWNTFVKFLENQYS